MKTIKVMIEKTFNIFCDERTHLENDGHPNICSMIMLV